MPLNLFYYYSHFTSYGTAAIYLWLSLSDTHRCIHPHTPMQTYTLTHMPNDCQKIPTPYLTKVFLSNTCYLFDLFPCICESAEFCLIYPVDQSLHVCFFLYGFGNSIHTQAYCNHKSPVSCFSLTTLLTPKVWVFSLHQPIFQLSRHQLGILQFSSDTDYRNQHRPHMLRVHSDKTAPTSNENCKPQATHTSD